MNLLLSTLISISLCGSILAWERHSYIRDVQQYGTINRARHLKTDSSAYIPPLPPKKTSLKGSQMSKIESTSSYSSSYSSSMKSLKGIGGKDLAGAAHKAMGIKSTKASSKGSVSSSGVYQMGMNKHHDGTGGGGGYEGGGDNGNGGMTDGNGLECFRTSITFLLDDVDDYYTEDQIGSGLIISAINGLPIYDTETMQRIGIFEDMSTRFGNDDNERCIGQGAFSLELKNNTYFDSQIFLQFTCTGEVNAITGGTGDFACATGYEDFLFANDTMIISEVLLCGQIPCTPGLTGTA